MSRPGSAWWKADSGVAAIEAAAKDADAPPASPLSTVCVRSTLPGEGELRRIAFFI
jgi:hypothetical protein